MGVVQKVIKWGGVVLLAAGLSSEARGLPFNGYPPPGWTYSNEGRSIATVDGVPIPNRFRITLDGKEYDVFEIESEGPINGKYQRGWIAKFNDNPVQDEELSKKLDEAAEIARALWLFPPEQIQGMKSRYNQAASSPVEQLTDVLEKAYNVELTLLTKNPEPARQQLVDIASEVAEAYAQEYEQNLRDNLSVEDLADPEGALRKLEQAFKSELSKKLELASSRMEFIAGKRQSLVETNSISYEDLQAATKALEQAREADVSMLLWSQENNPLTFVIENSFNALKIGSSDGDPASSPDAVRIAESIKTGLVDWLTKEDARQTQAKIARVRESSQLPTRELADQETLIQSYSEEDQAQLYFGMAMEASKRELTPEERNASIIALKKAQSLQPDNEKFKDGYGIFFYREGQRKIRTGDFEGAVRDLKVATNFNSDQRINDTLYETIQKAVDQRAGNLPIDDPLYRDCFAMWEKKGLEALKAGNHEQVEKCSLAQGSMLAEVIDHEGISREKVSEAYFAGELPPNIQQMLTSMMAVKAAEYLAKGEILDSLEVSLGFVERTIDQEPSLRSSFTDTLSQLYPSFAEQKLGQGLVDEAEELLSKFDTLRTINPKAEIVRGKVERIKEGQSHYHIAAELLTGFTAERESHFEKALEILTAEDKVLLGDALTFFNGGSAYFVDNRNATDGFRLSQRARELLEEGKNLGLIPDWQYEQLLGGYEFNLGVSIYLLGIEQLENGDRKKANQLLKQALDHINLALEVEPKDPNYRDWKKVIKQQIETGWERFGESLVSAPPSSGSSSSRAPIWYANTDYMPSGYQRPMVSGFSSTPRTGTTQIKPPSSDGWIYYPEGTVIRTTHEGKVFVGSKLIKNPERVEFDRKHNRYRHQD